jgi:regulator of replication initiation timing
MTMDKIELTREELVERNKQLCEENEKLRAELEEARLAVEHNRRVAEENQLRWELQYRDGIIYGLKYAIRCNGVSGAEVGL